MNAKLFDVNDLELKAGVVNGTELVGFYAKITEVENTQPKMDYLGLSDLFRQPLKNILIGKHGYTMEIVGGKAHIKLHNGTELGYAFFEALGKKSGKPAMVDISKLPQPIHEYFTKQMSDFVSISMGGDSPIVAQPQVAPQPKPVQPQPKPVQPQPKPVQPELQAGVPMANLIVETANGPIKRRPGQVFSCDELKLGQYQVYSVIDHRIQLPSYEGVTPEGVKLYGPDKYTEEECVALIQIQKLVDTTGHHLLNETEITALNAMLDGSEANTKTKGGSKEGDGRLDVAANQALIALYGMHSTIKQEITKVRKANRNVIELRDNLQKSIQDNSIPYDVGTKRFSFKYMAYVDENGEPMEATASPVLFQRVNQENAQGVEVTIQAPQKPTTNIAPVPVMQTATAPQAPRQLTPNNSPFVGVQQPKPSREATATAYIRKFLSTDGVTIEGIVFEISGTLTGTNKTTGEKLVKPVNGTFINSLERLQRSCPKFLHEVDFKNADFVVEQGKLVTVMDTTQLNQVDIVPEKRFIHPTEVPNAQTLFKGDSKLTEMLAKPVFEKKEVVAPAPTPTPVHVPAPLATPVVEATTLTPNVQNFLDFIKTQQGILQVVGIVDGSVKTVPVIIDELKAYLNI